MVAPFSSVGLTTENCQLGSTASHSAAVTKNAQHQAITYWCLAGNEGMIHFITSNNHPSNPQQPIHSLRLAPVR